MGIPHWDAPWSQQFPRSEKPLIFTEEFREWLRNQRKVETPHPSAKGRSE
jgi:hypothetical protein